MQILGFLVGVSMFLLLVAAFFRVRSRRRQSRLGPAAIGTVYDLLNEDKRRAVEIVIEERAEARDPEDADGNLPDLAGRTKPMSER